MKLSLVFVTVGLVAASAACSSRDRTEVERTTTTTITSAPMSAPQNAAITAEPNVATPAPAPAQTEAAVAPVPRDISPPAKSMPSTTAAAATTTAATAATGRPSRNSDLVERGQLVGPSLAPPQQPMVIFSNGPGATGSADFVQPSAASTESPSDFSPKPRIVAPTSTMGQITGFTGSPSSTASRGF